MRNFIVLLAGLFAFMLMAMTSSASTAALDVACEIQSIVDVDVGYITPTIIFESNQNQDFLFVEESYSYENFMTNPLIGILLKKVEVMNIGYNVNGSVNLLSISITKFSLSKIKSKNVFLELAGTEVIRC